MKYGVTVREVNTWTFEVEAQSKEHAYEEAKEMAMASGNCPDDSWFEEACNEEVPNE